MSLLGSSACQLCHPHPSMWRRKADGDRFYPRLQRAKMEAGVMSGLVFLFHFPQCYYNISLEMDPVYPLPRCPRRQNPVSSFPLTPTVWLSLAEPFTCCKVRAIRSTAIQRNPPFQEHNLEKDYLHHPQNSPSSACSHSLPLPLTCFLLPLSCLSQNVI